jgi:hypothetical protein
MRRCNFFCWGGGGHNVSSIAQIGAVCELRVEMYGAPANDVTFGKFRDNTNCCSTIMY